MAYSIPSDTHGVGDSGHTIDHNNICDVLAALPNGVHVNNTAYAGGADPTGARDSTAAFLAAIAALPTVTVNNGSSSTTYATGTLVLGAGSYKLGTSSDIGNIGPFVSVIGPGSTSCFLYDHGQTSGGAALNMHNAIRPSNDNWDTMLTQSAPCGVAAAMDGFTIDGTNAGAGRSGIDIGDMENMLFRGDVKIQHYNKSGSYGLNINNKYAWVNSFRGWVTLYDNTVNVSISGGGSPTGDIYDTFNDLGFTIYALAGQDGVALSGGAVYQFGSLKIRGSFLGSNSVMTSAALRLTGSAAITGSQLDIAVEQDVGTHGPYTIYIDTGCSIESCTGILWFNNTWTPSNITVATNPNPYQFQGFLGVIHGDANLNPPAVVTFAGPVLYTNPSSPTYTGVTYPPSDAGDFFTVTLGANTTVGLNYSGGQQAGPQRKTFVFKQPAAGGTYNYTLTWPHTGSPTLVLPTVLWASGSAPTMSTGAGATDMYELSTIDGVTWIGRATQNVS